MTDAQRELERCEQEISRLEELVVLLSEIVIRNIINNAGREQKKE